MAKIHKHAPWRKSFLIPFWTIQLLCLVIMIALLVLVLVLAEEVVEDYNDNSNNATISLTPVRILSGVWIALDATCLGLTIAEIVLLARYKLTPRFFLISSVLKCLILTATFVYDLESAIVHGATGRTSGFGFIVDIILLLCFYVPLIYGARIFHKHKHTYTSVAPALTEDTAYMSGTAGAGAAEMTGREYGHFASVSPGNRDIEAGEDFGVPTVSRDGREPFRGRRLSYNHERDMRYDPHAPYTTAGEQGAGDPLVAEHALAGLTRPSYREVPEVFVHQEDGQVFEMEGRRSYR